MIKINERTGTLLLPRAATIEEVRLQLHDELSTTDRAENHTLFADRADTSMMSIGQAALSINIGSIKSYFCEP